MSGLERTQPKRMPANWAPPVPAWSAVFGDEVKQVVMAGKVHKTTAFAPFLIIRLWPDWRWPRSK